MYIATQQADRVAGGEATVESGEEETLVEKKDEQAEGQEQPWVVVAMQKTKQYLQLEQLTMIQKLKVLRKKKQQTEVKQTVAEQKQILK